MTRSGRIRWVYDTLTPSLRTLPVVVGQSIDDILEDCAQQLQEYARANAPWQDRTGEAREGLTAEYLANEGAIVLYHTTDYGPWLEVRWSGQYAIIQPSIDVMGPQIMSQLHGIL